MNMQQDHELAKKIVGLLDRGAQGVDSAVAAKLLEARKQALAHYQQAPVQTWMPEWLLSTAGRSAGLFGGGMRSGAAILLVLLTSLVLTVTWQYWGQQGSEIAEIDAGLLTDELPINAYLDKGFDSWLKRPSR